MAKLERDYEPVLSRRCQSDIEVEHADCSGEAVIVVGTDSYRGVCQCRCHNTLKPKRAEERQEDRVPA